MPNNFIYFILSMIVLSCGSAKKANRQFESLPDWVKQKPQSDHSYYGLGKAPKNGFPDLYIKEAEKQALSDMAEQIETSVSSSSLRYQFDVENETSDFYMNTVKTKSDVFFEGYRVSKRYEDDNFYWNLVEITKSQFKSVNEKRKQNTLNNAYIKYNEANTYLENKEGAYKVIQSIVNSLEILKPFWNDSPIYTFKNGSELNLLEANINMLKYVFGGFSFEKKPQKFKVKNRQVLDKSMEIGFLVHPKIKKMDGFPFKISSTMYYGVSKEIRTELDGKLEMYPFKVLSKQSREDVTLTFSSVDLFKNLTSDLALRSLLNSYISLNVSEVYPIIIEGSKLRIITQIATDKIVKEVYSKEVEYLIAKERINVVDHQSKNASDLHVKISSVSENVFNIEIKLTNQEGIVTYERARTLRVDSMVYKTKFSVTKLLVSSFKRKELKAILPLLN